MYVCVNLDSMHACLYVRMHVHIPMCISVSIWASACLSVWDMYASPSRLSAARPTIELSSQLVALNGKTSCASGMFQLKGHIVELRREAGGGHGCLAQGSGALPAEGGLEASS